MVVTRDVKQEEQCIVCKQDFIPIIRTLVKDAVGRQPKIREVTQLVTWQRYQQLVTNW